MRLGRYAPQAIIQIITIPEDKEDIPMNKHNLTSKTKERLTPPYSPGLLGALMLVPLLGLPVTSANAATSYSFTLPGAGTTSAGVFKPDGTLVRTLWRKVAYSAGTHTSSPTVAPLNWDDKDDNGNTMPAGTYQIRVLYHNVTYTWEGVIGNTSSSFNGTGAHYNFLPITAMAFSGTNGYYCSSYNEAHYDFNKFSTTDPLTTTDHFAKYYDYRFGGFIKNEATDIYCRNWALAAADGTCVYYASPNCFDTTTNNNYGKPGFVIKYNVSDDSVANFTTAGQQLPSGPNDDLGWGDAHQYRVYPSALQVGTQPGVSGLAVQSSGSVLAVAVGADNKVYLYDKGTGASLGNFTVTNPQGMSFAPSGDLWVITGTTVKRYTSIGSSNTLATTISGFSAPLAVAVHPSNNDIVLVADGGASQQIKGYTSTGTAASGWSTPYGTAGGYASNGPAVTSSKFWFKSTGGSSGAFLAFQSDGSFWVGDEGNMRSLHFSSARAYLGQIQYSQYVRTVSVDLNAPTRVFNGWIEYQVDYSKTLTPGDPTATGGNNCWKLVKNWGSGLSSPYTDNGLDDNGLQTVVTLNSGRTWAMVNRSDGLREIAELQSGGLHMTGITFSGSSSLYANGDIRDYSITGGVLTVTRRQVTYDGTGTPTWGAATTLATASAGASDPVPHPGYTGDNGPRFPSTSTGIVISFDSSGGGAGGNLGMHLGGIKENTSQWLWGAAPGYTTGGVDGSGPDGLGSYSTDGDSFGGWDGTTAWTAGRNVLYNYNGQYSNFMNQFMHFWDDGLFVGQFGVTKAGIDFPNNGPAAGFASNAFSPCLVQVGSTLYVYQSDEMIHSGVHRWRVDGANSIAEITGSGAMDGTIVVGTAPPAPSGLNAVAGNGQVSLSWSASPGTASYNIYRGTSAGGESATAIATGITATTYVNTGLSNGTTYYYKVKAVNAVGASGYSGETLADPGTAPDLIVASTSWTPASPVAGSNVVFSAVVKNIGAAATPAGTILGVSWWVDGVGLIWEDTDVSSLAPGASRTETATGGHSGVNYWPATSGSHSIMAWVDDLNRFAETNESNNQLTKTMNVP